MVNLCERPADFLYGFSMNTLRQITLSAARRALPFLILLLLLLPPFLFARAGGLGAIFIYPAVLVYIGILHYKLHRKNREAADLIERISGGDGGSIKSTRPTPT